MRNLAIVMGDQLNDDSAIFDGFDRNRDLIWMAELGKYPAEAWAHKARITMLLSAMRHFEQRMTRRGYCVCYRQFDDRTNSHSLQTELRRSIEDFRPKGLVVVEPGEESVRRELGAAAEEAGLPLEVRADRHRKGRARQWGPDATTQEVMDLVETRFRRLPGSLAGFDWPVTPEEAEVALAKLIAQRHSAPDSASGPDSLLGAQVTAAIDLKLLDERKVPGIYRREERPSDNLKERDADPALQR